MKKTMNILIAGGAGYIGSQINKKLSGKGYQTVVLDNLSTGHREFAKWGSFHQCDLGEIENVRNIFSDYNISAVMHFSAFTYVGESVLNPQKYYINNVSNTLNLLRVMLEYDVRYFIFSSTAAIFGNPVEIPITEAHPQQPINPYGKSKLMIEQILNDYSNAYDFRYVALRYFNAAGADKDCEIGEWHEPETHLVPLVLDAALGVRDSIKVFGNDYNTKDGTCVRDYIHVSDLADAHVLALEYLLNEGSSQVFNLGNGTGFSVREVIDAAKKVTGKAIRALDADRRAGDPDILIANSTKAVDLLGWHPKFVHLEDIINTAWQWQKKINKK